MNNLTKGMTMNVFIDGDLVQAVKGDRRVIDRVVTSPPSLRFAGGQYLGAPSLFSPSSLAGYRSAGFTLSVVVNEPVEESTTVSGLEWVLETDWTKVQRGDTVRLTNDDKAEATVVVRNRRDPFARNTEQWIVSWTGTIYRAPDWRLFVQATPRPVLPSVPGTVIRAKGPGLVAMFSYASSGWFCLKQEAKMTDNELRKNFEGGFDVLEPVAETAKKVLDRVDGWYALGEKRTLTQYLAALRAEFGVTS